MTEHAPVDDYESLRNALNGLRDRGIRIAVDDTGAGFASLRHILQLSPEYVKLDISLTRGIATDASRRALAAARVAFAEELGAGIIEEGYLLGRPGELVPDALTG